jgi:hypothetical protein
VIPLLLIAIIAVILWKLIPPGDPFVRGFASLLSNPVIHRNAFSLFSGRSYVKGRYGGREVVLRLQLKRGRHGQGYLVIAVHVGGEPSPGHGLERAARDDAARRALFALAAEGLILSVEDGWLKAMWKPQELIIFPGRYSEEKWTTVLQAMQSVAVSFA